MNSLLRVSAAAIALFAAVPAANAQSTTIVQRPSAVIELSPAQRTIIYRHVVREPRIVLPPTTELRVGAPVPATVELHAFPDEVYVEAPTLRRYRYLYVNEQVVLVDPETSEIVEIIRE